MDLFSFVLMPGDINVAHIDVILKFNPRPSLCVSRVCVYKILFINNFIHILHYHGGLSDLGLSFFK